jgi:hypothetical protein
VKNTSVVKKRIPYGIGDFELIRIKNMYYVDKTRFIQDLEEHQYPFFIRPRRFGKSLLISMLQHYYDITGKDRFDELFRGLWIHDNPTPERNSYLVLRLDFSGVETSYGKDRLFDSFIVKVKNQVLFFLKKYEKLLNHNKNQAILEAKEPASIIDILCLVVKENQQKIYLLIDEYDNFANDLIGAHQDVVYYDLIRKTGFVRTFYEAIKEGAQTGAISRIFMTGVSPIMLDDLTSGFNIAKNITLKENFNESLGFTQSEVNMMMDYYHIGSEEEKRKALDDMKTYYDGYLFHKNCTQRLYNPDMVLHFMDSWKDGKYPDKMIDMNVKTDYGKVQRLIREDRGATEDSKIETILEKDEIVTNILEMFPLESISEREAFISLLFYMGLLTIQQPFMAIVKLQVPNLVIRRLFWEYIYHKVNRVLGDTLDIASIANVTQTLSQTGNPQEFVSYAYDKVMKYVSNRDLMHFDEKHIKIMLLSFLSMNQVYIPYSELEMNRGYSGIVLVPDSRYGVKNSQIWELKYIKENENPESKIQEAKEQIWRYEKDEKFLRLSHGTQVFRYILLAYKDRIDILEP